MLMPAIWLAVIELTVIDAAIFMRIPDETLGTPQMKLLWNSRRQAAAEMGKSSDGTCADHWLWTVE